MIKQLEDTPKEQREMAALAMLEHHFEDHSKFGDWCKRKGMSEEALDADRKSKGKF
jgi:hypothetical protein